MVQSDAGWLETLAARVAELRADLCGGLSSHWLSAADELLHNDEPSEALLQLAWSIAEEQVPVNETVRTFIETVVGDSLGLPRDVTGASRPVTSRRSARD